MSSNKGSHKSKVFAPYNFVQLNNCLIQYPENEKDERNAITDSLLSGTIEYSITAISPIMINKGFGDAGKSKGFFVDKRSGKYAVPGSTIRGLVRSNVQVLGLSDVTDDIDNYRLMFREIASGKDRKLYNDIVGSSQESEGGYIKSYVKNVKAGYLEKKETGYIIHPTKLNRIDDNHGEMNYYTLSEKVVLSNKKAYPALFPQDTHILQNIVIKPKGEKSTENKEYRPYIVEVSYNLSPDNRVIGVDQPGKLSLSGYAVSTGGIGGKRVLYIVPEVDKGANPIKVPVKSLNAFIVDYRRKKNGLSKKEGEHPIQMTERNYFALPKSGRLKPVFYLEFNGELYFGFTPRLKLFTKNDIHSGIKTKRKKDHIDMAQSIFGYANKKSSYKSKVSFSNAIVSNSAEEENPVNVVMAEPKPTFYAAYLKGKDGRTCSYNEKNGMSLRGIKQYWIHDNPNQVSTKDNKAVQSSFKPLPKGTEFKGTIRFNNLRREELGVLLWAIRLNDDSAMNIGYAKPYGYGAVKLMLSDVKVIDNEKAYSTKQFTMDPFKAVDVDVLIEDYKNYASRILGADINEYGPIKDLMIMKSLKFKPKSEDIKYMELGKDYRNNVRQYGILPYPEDLIEKE